MSNVARMIALRTGADAEPELIARMLERHELVRRGVSANLEPMQLSLEEQEP